MAKASTLEKSTALDQFQMRLDSVGTQYFVGYGCENAIAQLLASKELDGPLIFVCDAGLGSKPDSLIQRVQALTNHRVVSMTVSPAESSKSLATVERLAREAIHAGMTRKSTIVAFGGGLTANLAGMVAALAFRGLPLIHLPTTPVGAFDAVMSRKQAVNLDGIKNVLGVYSTPSLIAFDLQWLETVETAALRTGLAEMAKNVVAVRPDFIDTYLNAIDGLASDKAAALRALFTIGFESKNAVLASDPDEKGPALVFEYGHTAGHAIESIAKGERSHGECVAWGMLIAADVAKQMTGMSSGSHALHDAVLAPLGVLRADPPDIDPGLVAALTLRDNKRGYVPLAGDATGMVLLSEAGLVAGDPRMPISAVPVRLVEDCARRLFSGSR